MDGIILDNSDFSGISFQRLSINNNNRAYLVDTIKRWEKIYIYELLSNNTPLTQGLADLFCADALANNGIPQIPRFVFIYNEFQQQNGDRMVESKGMKDAFMSLITYHFVAEQASVHTGAGIATPNIDAADKATYRNSLRWAESRWNDAMETIKSIQWWLKTGNGNGGGISEYPEYIYDQSRRSKLQYRYSSLIG